MRIIPKLLAGALGCSMLALPVHADDFINVEEMFKNGAISGNKEVYIPRFTLTDSGSDGVYDYFAVRFEVYTRGTQTRLLKTTDKGTSFPSTPCPNPTWVETDFSPKMIYTNPSSGTDAGVERAILMARLYVECEGDDGYEYAEKTFLYSADVASTTSTAVCKAAWDLEPLGIDINDFDSDTSPEIALTMLDESSGTGVYKIRYLNRLTCAVEDANNYTGLVVK